MGRFSNGSSVPLLGKALMSLPSGEKSSSVNMSRLTLSALVLLLNSTPCYRIQIAEIHAQICSIRNKNNPYDLGADALVLEKDDVVGAVGRRVVQEHQIGQMAAVVARAELGLLNGLTRLEVE